MLAHTKCYLPAYVRALVLCNLHYLHPRRSHRNSEFPEQVALRILRFFFLLSLALERKKKRTKIIDVMGSEMRRQGERWKLFNGRRLVVTLQHIIVHKIGIAQWLSIDLSSIA